MNIERALTSLQNGKLIAYPTEAVYGLGCDPFNEQAVKRLLEIKQRSITKGLILIAATWQQIQNLVAVTDKKILEKAWQTWPGPVTWIFPVTAQVPAWIKGEHETIALRLTAHSLARAICQSFGCLVSTSANLTQEKPCLSADEVAEKFNDEIDYIVDGELGGLAKPTVIRDIMTGKIIRE